MVMLIERMFERGDYQLAFAPNKNFHIYINPEGRALSIAVVEGCKSTFFGDLHHIRKLIANGYFNDELEAITEYGRECFSGWYSQLFTDSKGKRFSVLRAPTPQQH